MILIPVLPVSRKRIVIISLVVSLLSIAALAILLWAAVPAGPPRGGLTRAQAIAAAWEHVNPGAVGVASAAVQKDFNTGFDLPVHHWTWIVTFYGHWELLCQGACDRTTEWVAVDYFSGTWIASQYSYPSRP
jgi:hypothetical protein